MPHSRESHSHEHMDGSHEHMSGSHEMGDHDGFWRGCSERFWGDDKHEVEAKRIALGASLLAIAVIIIVVTVIVVCCRRKKLMKAKHQKLAEEKSLPGEFDPDKHPKAKEAYPVVVVAPIHQGGKSDEAVPSDPRLTLGVWSPPPAYMEK